MLSSTVMEWNPKTPLQWDWENLVIFNGKATETPKQIRPTDWGMEGDGEIDSGSLYSSRGGARSGSDLGNGSSSKSSFSASVDSPSKGGVEFSEFKTVEDFPENTSQKKALLARAEGTGPSPTIGVSVVSNEPLIGLKLGKRTYFEDVCSGSTIKPCTLSVIPTSSSPISGKRFRASYQSTITPRCQVEGCDLDLTSAKDYHRRHRVCANHSKCPKVKISGMERRFCQQCSRFHDLSEFDEKKRSCRRRLSDHNARRRKPQPEEIQFNSASLSASFYDGMQQMGVMLNRVPLIHATKSATNSPWDSAPAVKVVEAKGCLMRPAKTASMDAQLHLPGNGLTNFVPSLQHVSEKPFPYKGTTAEVLHQGLEASVDASNLDPTPDLRRALSLLSTNSWSSDDPEPSSIDQLIQSNTTSFAQPVMRTSSHQGWLHASPDYWQTEQPPSHGRVHLTSHHNTSIQFQEFQLFKTPFEDGFYSNQLT